MQDHRYREFFSIELLQEQVRGEFNKKVENLDQDDPFYLSMYEILCNKLEEDLEATELFSKRNKKRKFQQKSPIDTIGNKIKNCSDIRKNKMIIKFNEHKSSSVKSITVKSESVVKCTTRFMSGKLLMFTKLSLKSFIYALVELLHFPEEDPDQVMSAIFEKYKIEQILCYQVLTDTDSTSIQFIIMSGPDSSYPDNVQDILFEIFSKTKICKRFDKSNEFWRKFNVHCPQDEKVLGLYEVEHIDGPCYVTLAVNPKEYFEYFKSDTCNKKHKGIKKGYPGMDYENYAERIKPLIHFETYKKPKADIKDVVRISVKKGEMTTHKIKKSKFSQLNDKRFYFPNTIVSLPFGHLALREIDEYKRGKGRRIEKYFWTEKKKLLELEKSALKNTPRVNFLNNILEQIPKIAHVDCAKFDRNTKFLYKEELQQDILDFILGAE